MKGSGWLGPFRNKSGNEVTEYSIGVEMDGEEVLIPTLVPGLTKDEINQVLIASEYGEMPRQSIILKAISHAQKMRSEGKSPFAPTPPNMVERIQEPNE